MEMKNNDEGRDQKGILEYQPVRQKAQGIVARLQFGDFHQVQRSGYQHHREHRGNGGNLVADHLGGASHGAQQRPFVIRGPSAHDDA